MGDKITLKEIIESIYEMILLRLFKIFIFHIKLSYLTYCWWNTISKQQRKWYKHQKEDINIIGFKWNCIKDKNTCEQCLQKDGVFLSIEDIHIGMPPIHDNSDSEEGFCRCFLTPLYREKNRDRDSEF